MREPNFKFDWFIPGQIIGLTHFHSEVTQEDIKGVMQKGQEITKNIENDFSILIDNRVVNMAGLMTLEQMVQMVSYVNHPMLRWVVVVKPESMLIDTTSLPIEKVGEKRLKNVSSLGEAIAFLRKEMPEIQTQKASESFFPSGEI